MGILPTGETGSTMRNGAWCVHQNHGSMREETRNAQNDDARNGIGPRCRPIRGGPGCDQAQWDPIDGDPTCTQGDVPATDEPHSPRAPALSPAITHAIRRYRSGVLRNSDMTVEQKARSSTNSYLGREIAGARCDPVICTVGLVRGHQQCLPFGRERAPPAAQTGCLRHSREGEQRDIRPTTIVGFARLCRSLPESVLSTRIERMENAQRPLPAGGETIAE